MTLTVREARVQLARPTIEKGMHISALLKVLRLRLQETVLCDATHGSMNHKKCPCVYNLLANYLITSKLLAYLILYPGPYVYRID
jgi:hypothetical protein